MVQVAKNKANTQVNEPAPESCVVRIYANLLYWREKIYADSVLSSTVYIYTVGHQQSALSFGL